MLSEAAYHLIHSPCSASSTSRDRKPEMERWPDSEWKRNYIGEGMTGTSGKIKLCKGKNWREEKKWLKNQNKKTRRRNWWRSYCLYTFALSINLIVLFRISSGLCRCCRRRRRRRVLMIKKHFMYLTRRFIDCIVTISRNAWQCTKFKRR